MHHFKLDRKNPKAGRTDWARIDALSDEEAEKAALDDPDARPVPASMLRKIRPVPNVRAIRTHLGMTVEEFARTYRLPASRIRAWEAGSLPLLPPERMFLSAIEARPDVMRLVISEISRGHGKPRNRNAPYFVVKSNSRWAVRKSDAERSTSIHDTQKGAIQAARELAKNNKVDLIVFGSDGQVRLRRRYDDSPAQRKNSA